MIDTREPKNGDFIAYLDQLQRESALRLLGERSREIFNQALPTHMKRDSGHFFTDQPAARSAKQSMVDAAISPWLRKVFLSMVPISIGALFFLYWLIAAATFVPLAVAIVLVAWGLRLFSRAARQLPTVRGPQAQAAVAKIFAQPTKIK